MECKVAAAAAAAALAACFLALFVVFFVGELSSSLADSYLNLFNLKEPLIWVLSNPFPLFEGLN